MIKFHLTHLILPTQEEFAESIKKVGLQPTPSKDGNNKTMCDKGKKVLKLGSLLVDEVPNANYFDIDDVSVIRSFYERNLINFGKCHGFTPNVYIDMEENSDKLKSVLNTVDLLFKDKRRVEFTLFYNFYNVDVAINISYPRPSGFILDLLVMEEFNKINVNLPFKKLKEYRNELNKLTNQFNICYKVNKFTSPEGEKDDFFTNPTKINVDNILGIF